MDLRDAFALAEHLLDQHGPAGWTVTLDSAKQRAGVCRFGPREIGLSAPLTVLHSQEQVRDTILHEIAHALVGPRHGHDAVWRRTALAIGCTGARCVPADAPRVEPAWLGVCPAGHTTGRHRRPERVMTCGRCASRFDLAHLYTWTHRGRPAVHHPNYEAELARIREGRPPVWVGVGQRARVTLAGAHHGTVGTVVKRARTSYHLAVPGGLLRVPFAGVEPVGGGAGARLTGRSSRRSGSG